MGWCAPRGAGGAGEGVEGWTRNDAVSAHAFRGRSKLPHPRCPPPPPCPTLITSASPRPHSLADIEVHLSRFHLRQGRALRIQTALRRFTAVRFLARCRLAAIKVQSAARRKFAWQRMRKRRKAAAIISRMAKGVKPRRQAQLRRNAATVIGRVARGRVTRMMILRMQSMVRAVPSLPRMGSMASFGSMKSLGSMKSFRERRGSLTVPLTGSVKHRLVARSNTVPVRGERGNGLARDKAKEVSRACVIS